MIYKSYLVLFVWFFVQNLATGMNLHDLSSIEIFINNVHERARSYYQVENVKINGDEKKDILKEIFYDLRKILTELNNISADSRNVSSSSGLVSFISTLEKFNRKNGFSLNSKLSDKLTKIINISETINSYVEPLLKLGADNISDDQDGLQFCPTDANAGQNYRFEYEKQIILKEYREFVEKLTTEIGYKNKFNTCGLTASLNEAIFVYFHNVIATYLKEYVMLYFIDIIDARCLDSKAAPILTFRHDEALIELKESIKLTKKFLAMSNYNIHNCDADYKTIDKPYYELKGMIETMIISEVDMTTMEDCSYNCDIKKISYDQRYDQCQEYSSCKYIGDKIDFCRVPDRWSLNRYQWIKSGDTIYGSGYPHCNQTIQTVSSSYSWWPPFLYCDYCLCTCHKKHKSAINTTPAISFREQVTDIENDMIVVGLRFVEKNRLIQIQVKERKLRVKSSEDKAYWKELEDIYHNLSPEEYHVKNPNSSFSILKENVHYGWTNKMNLDDLIAPPGYVVTGVRFKPAEMFFEKVSIMKTESIQLQIRVTPFDYTKGVLVNKNKTYWIIKPDYFYKDFLPLDNRDKPTRSPGNKIDSRSDQYVRFRNSDLRKDAGLSTVPFFDAQSVEGDPEFPLGGVGLVHRGHKGYGGFLALKIYDLNLSMYINDKSKTEL